jgi:hypothetical protein
MAKARTKSKGFSAWVVYWIVREDKVSKMTGTVITLLPRRYSTDTIQKIVEGLYAAYAYTYSGQEHFARTRSKFRNPLSRTTFEGKVIIGENPGLIAVLATDIAVKVDASGINQTISWTDPDSYEHARKSPYYRKVASGAFHKYAFNYNTHVQSQVS